MKKYLPLLLLLFFANCYALTADQDFNNRCTAAGVIYCNGFDASGDFALQSGGVGTGIQSGTVFAQDSATKSSGATALRVDIPQANVGDPGGMWVIFTSQSNATFYVQFQYRMTSRVPTLAAFGDGTSGVKIIDLYAGTSTCQSAEITLEMPSASGGEFTPYFACGHGLHVQPASAAALTFLDYDSSVTPYYSLQNNESRGWNCGFGNATILPYPGDSSSFGGPGASGFGSDLGTGCFNLPTTQWFTVYYKVHYGHSGSSDSSIEMWYASNRLPYAKFITILQITFTPIDAGSGFDALYLKPYMSQRAGTYTGAQESVWYDEVIVSTSPIAAPQPLTASGPVNFRYVPIKYLMDR